MHLKLVSSQSSEELAKRKSKKPVGVNVDPPEFTALGINAEKLIEAVLSSAPATDEELLKQAKALGTLEENLAQ